MSTKRGKLEGGGVGFGPPVGAKWLKPGPHWATVLVISEPATWVSHWDARIFKSVRCGGPGCSMCATGYQKQLRVVMMGIDISGRDRLFEVRERHRQLFDQYESTVGMELRIKKKGTANNSPVEVEVLGFRQAVERNILRLVESFGEEPRYVADWVNDLRPADELLDSWKPPAAGEIDESGLDVTTGRGKGAELERPWGVSQDNPPGFEGFE